MDGLLTSLGQALPDSFRAMKPGACDGTTGLWGNPSRRSDESRRRSDLGRLGLVRPRLDKEQSRKEDVHAFGSHRHRIRTGKQRTLERKNPTEEPRMAWIRSKANAVIVTLQRTSS